MSLAANYILTYTGEREPSGSEGAHRSHRGHRCDPRCKATARPQSLHSIAAPPAAHQRPKGGKASEDMFRALLAHSKCSVNVRYRRSFQKNTGDRCSIRGLPQSHTCRKRSIRRSQTSCRLAAGLVRAFQMRTHIRSLYEAVWGPLPPAHVRGQGRSPEADGRERPGEVALTRAFSTELRLTLGTRSCFIVRALGGGFGLETRGANSNHPHPHPRL